MKPFYSIQEIADILDEDVSAVCNCLIACGINSYFSGEKVNLRGRDSFFPRYSDRIYVHTGGPSRPNPSNTIVSTSELPELWIQSIESHEGEDGTDIEGHDVLADTQEKTALPTDSNATSGTSEKAAPPVPVVTDADGGEQVKPWLIADQRDPDPEQPWYTPARYFARTLCEETPSLLAKKAVLADKTALLLFTAGFKKRGGIKPFNGATVLKALVNIVLG